MPPAVKRTYRSSRREEQARQTRREIVAAGKRLFVGHGYGATSMQQIADEAGVAVQTVYAVFSNKRTLLTEVLDTSIAGDDEAVAVNDRAWMHAVFHDPGAPSRLRAYASAVRSIHERAADVFGVVEAAAQHDPEIAALAAEADARRRTGALAIVTGLDDLGALRPGLTPAKAVDLLWTFNSAALFRLLVRGSGWSLDEYEDWLAATMQHQILGRSSHRPRRSANLR